MTTEEMLLQLIEGQKQMTTDFNKRFDKIEEDIEELKENTMITRSAVNLLTDNFEDLVKELNSTKTLYYKIH